MDFDLGTVLADVVELLRPRAAEKGLNLACLLSPGAPSRLRGDPGRLEQVLLHLGGNAIKFTPQGGVTIRAALDHELQGRAVIRFLVEDTGIGIPADRQADIFSSFTQVDGSTTRKYGGAGLGLAISRQLVELLGGQIGVESRVGWGSLFWFTAAFEEQPRNSPVDLRRGEIRLVADHAAGRRGWSSRKRRPRILVADDNISNRQVAIAILEKLGCRSDGVANGKEALAMLQCIPYDLVLMDCQMPEMNGYEAAARIRDPRSGVSNSKVPVVALTAHAMDGDREKCLAAGMDDFVAKPVEPATLAAVIEKWLPGEGGIAASPAPIAAIVSEPLADEGSLLV